MGAVKKKKKTLIKISQKSQDTIVTRVQIPEESPLVTWNKSIV